MSGSEQQRFSWLRERRPLIIIWLVQMAILFSVRLLAPGLREHEIDLFYAVILVGAAGFIGFSIDALRFRARVARLERLPDPVALGMSVVAAPGGAAGMASADRMTTGDAFLDYVTARDRAYAAVLSKRDRELKENIEFYGAWIHELKTPISVLRLLAADAGNSSRLIAQIDRVQRYVDRAMFYLRSSSLSADMMLRPVDLCDVAEERLAVFDAPIRARELTVELTGVRHEATTDRKWLGFILDQLLQNAIRYTPSGGKITVVGAGEAHNPTLTIGDNGVGIPPEDLPRVFERGFTGTRGREFENTTGIGLYLVGKLIDRLGHEIAIESGIEGAGRGTRVTILFPRWGDRLQRNSVRLPSNVTET